MIGVEHRRQNAAQTDGDDAGHQPASHPDRDAHLRRREPVGDDRHVPARCEEADDGAACNDDRQNVERRTGQAPSFVFLVIREILGERRDQHAHQRTVEDAEEDSRNRGRGEKGIHLPARPIIARADDLTHEAKQRRCEGGSHDKERGAGDGDAMARALPLRNRPEVRLNALRPSGGRPERFWR